MHADPEGATPALMGDGWVTELHITNLELEGTLPAEQFCMFKRLKQIGVNGANFSGPIPPLICSCFDHLQKIDVGYNQMSGSLPACLAQMPWLQVRACMAQCMIAAC